MGLADDAELFHSPEEEGFALLTVDGHRECWPIRERGFRQWMSARYFHSEGKPPAAQALQDALNLLNARANHEGPEVPVSVRIAEHEGCVYLDLCNPSWEAVCIGADGWRIDPDPPVRFRRSRLSKALPRPQQHGSLDALRKLVNLPDDDAWRLAVGFLLGAMNPSGPYPLLVVQGEQGSAKSSLCRILRTVLDPSVVALRSPPREERDLAIAARSAWLLGFDNLSAVKDGLSDALCRLSTGGGFGTRKLYSDADEVVFAEMRPAILNGIPDLLTRPDLSDRAVVLHLKAISDDQRCSEKDLWERFEAAHPQVLGGLCDAVSGILRDREGLSLPVLPRMADFAAWVTAAEPALEWEPGSFVEIYKRCRSDRVHAAIGEDPVAQALLELAEQLPEWSGTATQLLGVLTERVGERAGKSRDWPKSAKSLANRLRRLAPDLRTVGLNVIDPQEAGRQPGTGARLWNLRRMDL